MIAELLGRVLTEDNQNDASPIGRAWPHRRSVDWTSQGYTMTAQPLRVLVIEDNPGDFDLLQEYLTEEGESSFSLEWADRLASGLACLDRNSIDVVLLDLGLPDSHGVGTLERVIRHAPTIPVVILTGLEEDSLGLEAVQKGAQDYVIKGHITARGIKRAIRYSVERFRASQQLHQQAAQLGLLTGQLPAILWTTDRELRITSSLGAGLQKLNLEPGQVVGMKLQDYLGINDHDFQPLTAHQEALNGKSASYDHSWMSRVFQTRIEPLRQGEQIVGTIGVALDITDQKRVQTEFRIAQRIQQGLLPRSMPTLPPFDIGGIMSPAEETGGDFFDFIPLPDGSLVVAIGDASGHGFGPALLAAVVHAALHTLSLAGLPIDLNSMLSTCNRLLCLDPDRETFVTLLLVRLDPGTRTLNCGNAGHPSCVVMDSSANVKACLPSNMAPLGIQPDEPDTMPPGLTLDSGDTILLVTDGILETMSSDNSLFGMGRMQEVFRSHRHLSAQEIAKEIIHSAREFVMRSVQHDDATVVVIKIE